MEEVLEYLASMVWWTATTFLVVWNDERNLSKEEKARAWPPASRWSAFVAFPLLCIPIHFWRTRRSLLGVWLGFSYVIVLVKITDLLGELIGAW